MPLCPVISTLIQLQKIRNHISGGKCEVTYRKSLYGRWYNDNIHIQSMKREIRHQLFSGFAYADIDAAHQRFLKYLANKINLETPELDNYIRNKKAIRHQVTEEIFGLVNNETMQMTKEYFIKVMFGASLRNNKDEDGHLFQDCIMNDDFKANPTFGKFFKEVRYVTKAIDESGILITHESDINIRKKMAFEMQSMEELVMSHVLGQLNTHDFVLIHDGLYVNCPQEHLDMAIKTTREYFETNDGIEILFG